MIQQWLLWQVIDSAFPTGSFAHSSGLEAAWQQGLVVDQPTLDQFVHAGAVAAAAGPLVFVALACLSQQDFTNVDRDCDLFLNHEVANHASRSQGQALLASAASAWENHQLEALNRQIRGRLTPGHLAPAFGRVLRTIGCEPVEAQRLFQFATARSTLSAAVRLGIVGPLCAQQMLAQLPDHLPVPTACVEEPASVNPLLDLLQAQQSRLYSRLFQS